ncbi:hypothetical protein VaNZ11_015775 [Volvox africanus]|uniref:MADS-box domain-containing protein n=1 Tax=Volvox africanus TaxID=51714 RepID=A0ABQ5SMN7_9CHLO|nr:hypothetical protein VaNZ11_015775 [Volvox africanus]
MEEITRSKVQLRRTTDDRLLQDMFAKRKQTLVKKAMELSVLCDCDVGLIIFGPGSSGPGTGGQRLYQYSSISMDELLERYAAAVAEPHERRRNGELLRHYYELSPDDDGEEAAARNGNGGASTSAAAAEAAATMAAVDSIILGGGGRRLEGREGITGLLKRMRMNSPGLDGIGAYGDHMAAVGGAPRPLLSSSGLSAVPGPGSGPAVGMINNGQGSLVPPGVGAPLRRLGAASIPLEGIKAAGFLDKRNYPVSPRSEKAYEEITAEFDKLTEMRSQRAGNSGRQNTPTVLQPLSSSLASHQQHLQQILHQQQLLQQQRQQEQQQQQGGGAKRFKPLSILVPELQTHPIIPTNLTPLQSAPGGAVSGPSAAADGSASTSGRSCEAVHSAANGPEPHGTLLQQQQPHPTLQFNSNRQQHPQQQQHHSQQQQGGLPPRPPDGCLPSSRPKSTQSQGSLALGVGTGGLHSGRGITGSSPSPPRPMAISPTTSGVGPPLSAGMGPGEAGALAAPMEVDGGGANGNSSGPFVLDRRGGTALGDEGLASLLGASAFRTSLDGSAANLLTLPSPPPHSAANALFGSLDGGPLSMRSGSHGMLGSLGSLDRGASMGLGSLAMSLESPGGHVGLETALRGLAPMDVLDWPSMSPRSSTGNGDAPAGSGGFPDEVEGGTVLDGLVVRGTSLSKLAPGALEAAIGPSPDTCGGGSGTPVSTRARVSLSAFSGHTVATSTATQGQQPDAAPGLGSTPGSAETQQGVLSSHGSVLLGRGAVTGMRVAHGADGEDLSGSRHSSANAGVDSPHGRCEAVAHGTKPSREVGSDREGGRLGSLALADSMGLTPELSLNDMCPGGIDAAATAAVAAVHAQEGKGGGEAHGAAAEGLLGLEVVGKALVLPSGARTNAVHGGGPAQGTAGG